MILKVLHFVFVENAVLTPLARKTSLRTHQAFCPKMRQAYDAMFKVFVAFCIVGGVLLPDVNVKMSCRFLNVRCKIIVHVLCWRIICQP